MLSYREDIGQTTIHVGEMEKEFEEVLRNNVITPHNVGKNFAFKHTGTKRFKHVTQLFFEAYGVYEIERYYNNSTVLGKVIVTVKVK